MDKGCSLVFGESWEEQGFRNSKGSISRFPEASIITRELIQNALDANKSGKVKISFQIGSVPLKDLPGVQEYKRVFKAAKAERHANDTGVIDKIEKALSQDEVKVLWVTDNGSGLDTENMRRLLGDGVSEKDGEAGSYGLGHLAAFRASNLNYVIYGGCAKNERILSGQCILASHCKGEQMFSPNGYICIDNGEKNPRKRTFPKVSDLGEGPWKTKLQQVNKGETGSFVCITAFNNFGGKKTDEEVQQEILYEAASHFMPAIFEGKMEVRVGDEVLKDEQGLHKVIATRKLEPNIRRNALVGTAGSSFYNIYMCLQQKQVEFDVSALSKETVRVVMDLMPVNKKRSIHLFRYGMWITHNLPYLGNNKFGGYKPFTALILVDRKAKKTSKLIAKAEGERHMQIRRDELTEEEDGNLKNILERVKAGIKEKALEIDSNPEPLDFIDFGSEGGGVYELDDNVPNKPRRPRPKPVPPPVPPDPPEPHPTPNGDEPDHKKRYQRKARKLPISCTVPVFESGEIRFLARADKKYDNVEVRVVTKSGSDRSCAQPIPDQFVYLKREEGKRNEKPIPVESYIPEFQKQEKKKYVAVKLGTVSKGETMFSLKPAATPPPSGRTYLVEFVVGKRGER